MCVSHEHSGVFMSRNKSNMTLGIVGMGGIGSQVAKVCSAIGMDVCYFDPFLTNSDNSESGEKFRSLRSLDDLLALSDIVIIHVPFNSKTKQLFCKKKYQK